MWSFDYSMFKQTLVHVIFWLQYVQANNKIILPWRSDASASWEGSLQHAGCTFALLKVYTAHIDFKNKFMFPGVSTNRKWRTWNKIRIIPRFNMFTSKTMKPRLPQVQKRPHVTDEWFNNNFAQKIVKYSHVQF